MTDFSELLLMLQVIVPNMMLGESDQEMFEDDPEEWIRRDMEGSDVDTRRRAACDLVRALCRFFQKEVLFIFYLSSPIFLHISFSPSLFVRCAIFLYTCFLFSGR